MNHDTDNDTSADQNTAPEPLCRRAAPQDADMRLDQFWVREFTGQGVSRERIKEWIAAGLALVDGKVCAKPGQRLEGREQLTLSAPDLTGDDSPKAEDADLDIIYRDKCLAVINKPAGLTTHPAPSQPDQTLVNRCSIICRNWPRKFPACRASGPASSTGSTRTPAGSSWWP